MSKKLLALAIAAMMVLTCLSVSAANELTADNLGGGQDALPAPWVTVDDTKLDMITYYDSEGNSANDELAQLIEGEHSGALTSDNVWQYFCNAGHLYQQQNINGNYSEGATLDFTFVGEAVAVFTQYRRIAPNAASIEVYIDGELVTTVENPGSEADNDTSRYVYFQKTDLSKAEHVLTLKAVTAGQMAIDGFGYIPCEIDNPPAGDDDNDNPSTGDATMAALAIAAAASLGAVLVIGKKH